MRRGRGALRKIVLGPKTIETKGENQVFMYILECMCVHVYNWIKEKGKAYIPLHLFLAHGSGLYEQLSVWRVPNSTEAASVRGAGECVI